MQIQMIRFQKIGIKTLELILKGSGIILSIILAYLKQRAFASGSIVDYQLILNGKRLQEELMEENIPGEMIGMMEFVATIRN